MDNDLEFRRQLYKISIRLSSDDVQNIKFYCMDDYISRRQVDGAQSGFQLFCLLVDKGLVSKDDTTLLKTLLDLVSKGDCIQLLCARPLQEGNDPPYRALMLANPAFKSLLKEVGDSLPQKQLRDVAYFFSGSVLTAQDAEDVKRPEEVFQKLKDCRIGVDTLLTVFDAIGRQDLCEKVNKKCLNMPDDIRVATTDINPSSNVPYPVQEVGGRGGGSGSSLGSCDRGSSGSLGSYDSSLGLNDPVRSTSSDTTLSSMQDRDNCNRGTTSTGGQRGVAPQDEVKRLEWLEKDIQKKLREASQKTGAHPFDSSHHLDEEIQRLRMEVSTLRERLVKSGNIELYTMTHTPHGIAIIIVNEHFDARHPHLKQREGAAVDSRNFKELFTFLRYEVEVHKNLTSASMMKVVEAAAKKDHGAYDSFALCVSTHGTESTLYGTDGKEVRRCDLFGPLKKCLTLTGKPKMFFIQACRLVESSPLNPPDLQGGMAPGSPLHPHLDADCFVANSTTSQQASYRSTQSGSWFVSAIFKVFIDNSHTHTLTSMMHLVNTMVLCEGRGYSASAEGVCTQCAEVTSTCTKDIRF